MDYLPICLDLRGKPVAVVGGGTVAARRTESALRAGATVRVYAEALGAEFATLSAHARFSHRAAAPLPEELRDCALVFCAADAARNRATAALARAVAVPVNVADAPAECDFIMPAIVDREPLLIAVSTGGAAPMFARLVRTQLERTLPAGYGRALEFLGRERQRIAAALPEPALRRRLWEGLLDGAVLERLLQGDFAAAATELERELAAAVAGATAPAVGEVYLVGAGPGDPDLLTLKALRLMQRADVVVYDRLIGEGILDLVRRDAERIYVGKLPREHVVSQAEISALLVRLARAGRRVLRLKGGDPFLFGRGGEEIEELLAEGITVQVVPGITAASGCAAYAGIPLTHRDHAQACLLVTAHVRKQGLGLDWPALLRPRQTVAIYMGLGQLAQLLEEFRAHGADPELPAALIDNGTRPTQSVVTGTLSTLAARVARAGLRGPAMIIVGSVVSLRTAGPDAPPAAPR